MTATTEVGPRATDRGLALLRVVADQPGGISLADAARAVELTPSTALRQLRALEAAGFASRSDEGVYVPGPELLRIARALAAAVPLARAAEPLLHRLAEQTGETAYLVEPAGPGHGVYTAMSPGSHSVRHVSWLGHRITRRGTALGAALGGRVDPDGAVVRVDAMEEGVTAISAPVRNVHGEVVAAVSVLGPSYRLTADLLAAARRAVAAAASELGRLAGSSGSA